MNMSLSSGVQSTKSASSCDIAGPAGVRAFLRETNAVNLVIRVHSAHGLSGACGRAGGCGIGGRRRAARARADASESLTSVFAS